MLPSRPAFFAICLLCLPSACTDSGFPDIAPTTSVETRDIPWPEFLPISFLLADSPADFEAASRSIRAMQGRVAALKRRAGLLRAPVPDAQEALRRYSERRKSPG